MRVFTRQSKKHGQRRCIKRIKEEVPANFSSEWVWKEAALKNELADMKAALKKTRKKVHSKVKKL